MRTSATVASLVRATVARVSPQLVVVRTRLLRLVPSLPLIHPLLGGRGIPSITDTPLSYLAIKHNNGMDLRGHRGTAWSLTCNLKEVNRATVDSCIERAKSMGWGVEGQLEAGDQGTQHYQLLLRTPQCRFSAVKRCFPTAHIELARNVKALQSYVHKEETRVESLKSVEVTFVTWKMLRDKFFEWLVCELDVEACFIHDDTGRLAYWDRFIGLSITEGMEVDTLGVNPQYRSCIIRYWNSYVDREVRRHLDRQTDKDTQTDRQTDSQDISLPPIT